MDNYEFSAIALLGSLPHTDFKTVIVNDAGVKEPIGIVKGRLNMTIDELKKYSNKNNLTHQWIEILPMKTDNLFIIDQDEKGPNIKNIDNIITQLKHTVTFETNKGYHYYIYINNFPSDKIITNEVDIFNSECPKSDLLHFNKVVWEKKDRISKNKNIIELDYNDIIKYIKSERIVNRPEVKPEVKPVVKEQALPVDTIVKEQALPADTNDIKQLLSLLSNDRVNNYTDWINVAFICKSSGVPYALFDEWSKLGDSYDEDKNMSYWMNIKEYYKGPPLTIASLYYMAKLDNPVKYNELFNSAKSYAETKKEFEKKHFKVMNPLCYITIDNSEELNFKNKSDLKNAYENLYYKIVNKKGETENKPFIDAWLKDTTIRTYDKIDFLPTGMTCSNNIYNLFKGLNVEHIEKSNDSIDLSPIKYHIENILCNGEKCSYEFFYKWLAQIIQQPSVIKGVALVFISGQGAGKNTFFDWFGNQVLGNDYYTTTCNIEHILGRFANGLTNKLLVNLDETRGKDTFDKNDTLKSLITANTINYEKKQFDVIQLNNFSRFVFTTNNTTPIKIEHDDRRFVVYQCSDKLKNNKEYFTKLYSWLGDKKNARAFYDFLMTIDISNVDWVNDRPKTAAYKDLQQVNIPLVARFLTDSYYSRTTDVLRISAKDIFNKFNNWLESNKFKVEFNSTSFGRELNRYSGIESKKSHGLIIYIIDYKNVHQYLDKMNYLEDIEEIEEDEELDS